MEQDRDNINYRFHFRTLAILRVRHCGACKRIQRLKTGVEFRKGFLQPIEVWCARHTSLSSLTDCCVFGQSARFLQRESVGGCLYRAGPEWEEWALGIAAIFSLLSPGAVSGFRIVNASFAEFVDGGFSTVHCSPLALCASAVF